MAFPVPTGVPLDSFINAGADTDSLTAKCPMGAKARAPIASVPSTPALPCNSLQNDEAEAYESTHVHSIYDNIAPHFAATRYAPWPRIDSFVHGLPPDSLVADVGCGNGKYLMVAEGAPSSPFIVGTDRCAPLLSIVQKRRLQRGDVAVSDAMHMPIRDGMFDAVLNIAVVHHFVSKERRVRAWMESIRLLRAGGRAILYVWALERPSVPEPRRGNNGKKMLSRRFDSQDMFVPWHMRRRKKGATSDKILGDTEDIYMRYYHVYTKGELEQELAEVPGASIIESYYDHQNWCAIVEKMPAK